MLDQLGEREIEILRQFAGGATTEEIAARLNLSVKTVQNYHYLIKTKTGARTDAQLCGWLQAAGSRQSSSDAVARRSLRLTPDALGFV